MPAWTMSSETSTEPQPSFEPWQLFTLAGLIGATIAVFMARGESPAAVIMISLTIFAAAAVGIAALRTFLPLDAEIVERRRRECWADAPVRRSSARRALVLRSIKELEFDRAMGKVSEKDFAEMSGRLRARAARLMRQLDAGAGYRREIEREIVKRIGVAGSTGQARPTLWWTDSRRHQRVSPSRPATTCASCSTANDADARFCKHCGHALEAR